MPNKSQDIINWLDQTRKAMAPCEDCGGSGERRSCITMTCPVDGTVAPPEYGCKHLDAKCFHGQRYHICPTCAEIRGLDLCWHETDSGLHATMHTPHKCKHCGQKYLDNPDLTTHMHGSKLWIVHAMQVLGLWDEFVEWHDLKCFAKLRMKGDWCVADFSLRARASADILTDGKHLVDALHSFSREREGV